MAKKLLHNNTTNRYTWNQSYWLFVLCCIVAYLYTTFSIDGNQLSWPSHDSYVKEYLNSLSDLLHFPSSSSNTCNAAAPSKPITVTTTEPLLNPYQLPVPPRQDSELSLAHTVLMHLPLEELFYSSLHTSGSLFEKPTSPSRVADNHRGFQEVMKREGINVVLLKDVLINSCGVGNAEDSQFLPMKFYESSCTMDKTNSGVPTGPTSSHCCLVLHEILASIQYHLIDSTTGEDQVLSLSDLSKSNSTSLKVQLEKFVDEYKRQSLYYYTMHELVNLLTTRPVLYLRESPLNTHLVLEKIALKPLGNLLFTRDQLIVTNKGIVSSNMNSLQRKDEVGIVELALKVLEWPIIGRIQDKPLATLEGGDFLTISKDVSFIGIGLRTNLLAAYHLLESNLLGVERLALFVDSKDFNQDRMHLDTIMNIISKHVLIALDDLLDERLGRIIYEYTNKLDSNGNLPSYCNQRLNNDTNDNGTIYISKTTNEIKQSAGDYKLCNVLDVKHYFQLLDFAVIPISSKQQSEYIVNFVNLGSNRILAVNKEVEKEVSNLMNVCNKNYNYNNEENKSLILQSKYRFNSNCNSEKWKVIENELNSVKIEYIEYQFVKAMYGAAHCSTQFLRY